MDVYGPLFRRILFPAYESGLRRRNTLAHLDEYQRSQWLSFDEVAALQWRKLERLVAHCWEQVPYYRARWAEAGVSGPQDIRNPGDYAQLPVLTKDDVRANFEDLHARDHVGKVLYKTTGGSTGEPLRIGYTRESYERRVAVMHRGYGWAGATLGARALYFWGVPMEGVPVKDRLMQRAFNRRVVNVFTMRDDDMARYADAIDEFRPRVVVAYVAAAVRVARWLLESGRKVHRPQSVICAAEPLAPHERDLIERGFGCPVYNTYGCREVMLVAAECETGEGLHVNADHLCVELGEPIAGGEGKRPVRLTDLHNYGMPLMRYENGDLATASTAQCSCGRGLPMLASIDGRTMDALRDSAGHFVGEYLEHLVFNTPGIRRFQAVQERLDVIEVSYVAAEGFDEAALQDIALAMREAFGDTVRLDFRRTSEIPLTPTGKLRVAISRL
ncbi:phenylacetate--CoA ligase family protein [uncultured Luteimonas sp.]|uniref:phenylacetate--CoA ligase family protein n=1 Tax=uncultured Luteimonas sp. TaxID=453144 RepID=UPI002638903B|nr:phenylacetate--CoA ligase family protein [uncultured Luteimonas sp.]